MSKNKNVLYIVNSLPPEKEVYIQSDLKYCNCFNGKWVEVNWNDDSLNVEELYDWIASEPNTIIHKRMQSFELITIEELFEKEPELFTFFL